MTGEGRLTSETTLTATLTPALSRVRERVGVRVTALPSATSLQPQRMPCFDSSITCAAFCFVTNPGPVITTPAGISP